MFNFNDYTKEIRKISKEQNVDMSVAFDKFRADIRIGIARPYNTADTLKSFDFGKAKREWDKLTIEEQNKVIADYNY